MMINTGVGSETFAQIWPGWKKCPLPIGAYLHIYACYSYCKCNCYYLQQPYISQKW